MNWFIMMDRCFAVRVMPRFLIYIKYIINTSKMMCLFICSSLTKEMVSVWSAASCHVIPFLFPPIGKGGKEKWAADERRVCVCV